VRKRRRLRTVLLVVALAAIVGGGGAVALQQWDQNSKSDGGTGTSSASGSPSPSGSPTGSAHGTLPANWQAYDDPWGFTVYLPKGWTRRVVGIDGDLRQVDYTPDNEKHFLRIAIDTSPDFTNAYDHQKNLEQQLKHRFADFKTVRMEENTYRDRPGSLWDATWTAPANGTKFPGPWRAIEETYFSPEGTEYAIYMASPADDWAKTSKQFKSVLQGWQEKTTQ